jgi:hypothetical protein
VRTPTIPTSTAVRLVEGALPWDQSIQLDIFNFLKLYTLHDSLWIGLYTDCAWEDSSVAAIRFDPVWNPSVGTPTSVVADWPLLFLRFTCVTSIQLAGFSNIDDTRRGISGATAEPLSEEEAVTKIVDHYGGSVSLRHFPLVEVLVLAEDETVRKLSVPQRN